MIILPEMKIFFQEKEKSPKRSLFSSFFPPVQALELGATIKKIFFVNDRIQFPSQVDRQSQVLERFHRIKYDDENISKISKQSEEDIHSRKGFKDSGVRGLGGSRMPTPLDPLDP
jgi:hypothetical protein